MFLITWFVDSNGIITEATEDTVGAGEISEISLIRLYKNGANQLVSTTVKQGDGRAKVIVWEVTPDGQINRLVDSDEDTDSRIGEASLISSVFLRGYLVVSCRSAINKLVLISFRVYHDEVTMRWKIERLYDTHGQAGWISDNATIALPPYGMGRFVVGDLLSAVRTQSDNLLLIKWRISSKGELTRMYPDSGQHPAFDVDIPSFIALNRIRETPGWKASIVTSMRDVDRNLFLITWGYKPS